jgi:hypothetical protein
MTSQELEGRDLLDAFEEEEGALRLLQQRVDDLGGRIRDVIPEGYDLHALLAQYRMDVVEDVFEITGDHDALTRLTGPVAVPGATPPPAFETKQPEHLDLEGAEAAIPGRRRLALLWKLLIVLVVVAVVVGAVIAFGVV